MRIRSKYGGFVWVNVLRFYLWKYHFRLRKRALCSIGIHHWIVSSLGPHTFCFYCSARIWPDEYRSVKKRSEK